MKKRSGLVALLLAVLMLLQSVAFATEVETEPVPLKDLDIASYDVMLSGAREVDGNVSIYNSYLNSLEGLSYEERYNKLVEWKSTVVLGSLFYNSVINYYNTNNPEGDLICVCESPLPYGALNHNADCRWGFKKLPLVKQYEIMNNADEAQKEGYKALLSEEELDALNRVNAKSYTAVIGDASVAIAVQEESFDTDYQIKVRGVAEDTAIQDAVSGLVMGEGAEYTQTVAIYDIAFDGLTTGEEVQPAKNAPVELNFEVPTSCLTVEDGNTLEVLAVYHIVETADGYRAELIGEPVDVDPDKATQNISIQADAFSYYVLQGANRQYISTVYSIVPGESITIYNDESGEWRNISVSNNSMSYTQSTGSITINSTAGSEGSITLNYRKNAYETQTIIVYAAYSKTVTFETNYPSGTGLAAKEQTLTTADAGAFSFPTPESIGFEIPDGYGFAGWCTTDDDAKGSSTYSAGIEHRIGVNTTYYAQWYKKEATSGTTAYFYIRANGEIPYEPSVDTNASDYYPVDGWYSAHADTNKGWIKSAVSINNNLEAVDKNIGSVEANGRPSPTEIDSFLGDNYVTIMGDNGEATQVRFDPNLHEVVWYVIKNDCSGGSNVGSHYHVDGIVKGINQVILTYDPNGGDSNVPTAKAYNPYTNVTVDFTKIPFRAGYEFLGWSDDPTDPTPIYPHDGVTRTHTMPNHNDTLYAIWRPSNSTIYKVEHYTVDNGVAATDPFASVDHYGVTDTTVTINASNIDSYKVAKEGYTVDLTYEASVLSGIVDPVTPLVLELYYVRDTGNLSITKTVKDSTFTEGSRTFEFTVEPAAGTEKAAGEFAAWAAKQNPALTVTENKVTVSITVDASDADKTQQITLTGLPTGSYIVKETGTEPSGTVYNTVYAPASEDAAAGIATVTKDPANTANVAVTNTAAGTDDIVVIKKWEDNDNASGNRPASIEVTLTGAAANTITLTADNAVPGNANEWIYTWANMPRFDANGNQITYTVTEAAVANYTGTYESLDVGTTKFTDGTVGISRSVTITNSLNSIDVTLTKLVTGNMGDRNKKFSFTVVNENGATIASGELAHGETMTLPGVVIGSTITVTETNRLGYNSTGFGVNGESSTVTHVGSVTADSAEAVATVTVGADLTTITVTNTKQENVDTGVTLDTLPYLLMLAIAGIAVWAARRRRYE